MSKPNLYKVERPIKPGYRIFCISQVAQEADVSRRSAQRWIKRAVERGEIEALRALPPSTIGWR